MVNAKDFQFDTMVDTAKDVAIKTVAFNSTLAQETIAYFDSVTEKKFNTYTMWFKKGIVDFTDATEKFIKTGQVQNIFANST